MKAQLVKALEELSEATRTLSRRARSGELPSSERTEEQLIRAVRDLTEVMNVAARVETGKTTEEADLCADCDKEDQCQEPCERVEGELPGVYEGRGRKESLGGLYETPESRSTKGLYRERFRIYENHKHIFTNQQWAALKLCLGEGKTQAEAAQLLGISRSTVAGRLSRAEERLEKHLTRQNPTKPDQTRQKMTARDEMLHIQKAAREWKKRVCHEDLCREMK